MLNYKVKYSIATYNLDNQKENLAILGVYDMNNYKSLEENMLNLKKNFDDEIIIESSLGGGPVYPSRIKSTQIIIEEHEVALKYYINSIISKLKEDTIVMFTNQDPYGLIPIYLLSLYAKELNKKIICIGIGVCIFEGKAANNNFSYLWDKIKNQADEAILIDCNLVISQVKKNVGLKEFELLIFNKYIEKLYSIATK